VLQKKIMITIKIKENSKQAKLFVEYAKSLSFVEIQDSNSATTKRSKAKLKSAIAISLEEEKKGKTNFYNNSSDLFNKVLNV
jgi:hypothetical protein